MGHDGSPEVTSHPSRPTNRELRIKRQKTRKPKSGRPLLLLKSPKIKILPIANRGSRLPAARSARAARRASGRERGTGPSTHTGGPSSSTQKIRKGPLLLQPHTSPNTSEDQPIDSQLQHTKSHHHRVVSATEGESSSSIPLTLTNEEKTSGDLQLQPKAHTRKQA